MKFTFEQKWIGGFGVLIMQDGLPTQELLLQRSLKPFTADIDIDRSKPFRLEIIFHALGGGSVFTYKGGIKSLGMAVIAAFTEGSTGLRKAKIG